MNGVVWVKTSMNTRVSDYWQGETLSFAELRRMAESYLDAEAFERNEI
jgi:hypothetical protein